MLILKRGLKRRQWARKWQEYIGIFEAREFFMPKAIIAQFYKTEAKAAKRASELQELWKGKVAWYILCAENGYFVISETAARKCFPDLKFGYKDRRY